MKKKVSFFCLAEIVVIAGGMFLFSGKKAGGGMKLETEKVSRSSISNVVTATGTVEPVTEVMSVLRFLVLCRSCMRTIMMW